MKNNDLNSILNEVDRYNNNINRHLKDYYNILLDVKNIIGEGFLIFQVVNNRSSSPIKDIYKNVKKDINLLKSNYTELQITTNDNDILFYECFRLIDEIDSYISEEI